MKCPKCQHDMISAKNGHMCLNCGYAESVDPHTIPLVPTDVSAKIVTPVAPVVTTDPTVKDAIKIEDQVKRDMADAVAAVEQPQLTTPALSAAEIIKPKRKPKVEDKPVDSLGAQGRTKGTLDLKPTNEDLLKGAVSAAVVDAIGPSMAAVEPAAPVEPITPVEPMAPAPIQEPEPVKHIEAGAPEHVIDHDAQANADTVSVAAETSVPLVIETSVPLAEPAVVTTTQSPSKEPLIAKTHPQGTSTTRVMMIVGALVILSGATLGAYYFTSAKSANKVDDKVVTAQQESVVSKTATPVVVDGSPSPTATPVVTPEASSALDRDSKRKADIASYAASIKAAGSNGFYPTSAPAISRQLLDPTTAKPYVVATTTATNLGEIRYLAGGKCSAPSVTPGKTSTRYIALSMKLETGSAPYCIEVK